MAVSDVHSGSGAPVATATRSGANCHKLGPARSSVSVRLGNTTSIVMLLWRPRILRARLARWHHGQLNATNKWYRFFSGGKSGSPIACRKPLTPRTNSPLARCFVAFVCIYLIEVLRGAFIILSALAVLHVYLLNPAKLAPLRSAISRFQVVMSEWRKSDKLE